MLSGPQRQAAFAGQTAIVYRVTGGTAVAAPVDGAAAEGCVAVSPTVEPGWFVGFSVPAAFGRLFAVFGVDSLEPPEGGF